VGHVGLVALSESLVENGVADVMYGIVNQTTYPGWGYMVANGATTIWESWGRDWATPGGRRRADSMTMLGSVDRFFYNHLAGIQGPTFFGPEIMQPGFKEFRIQPHVLDDMQYARAEVTTVRGAIRSAWQRAAGTFELCVEIPVNCRATICIPKCGLTHVTVTQGQRALWVKWASAVTPRMGESFV
jgi:alpha-L-rhamnosidase